MRVNPVRKHFEADSLFPFSFVHKDTKSSQAELPDHFHDWYELVYVHRGKGTFFIDRSLYDMRPGDLFVIPGNTIHRAFPDAQQPVTSTAVYFSRSLVEDAGLGDSFSYLLGFDASKKRKCYQYSYAADERQALEAAIERIAEELRLGLRGYRQAIVLELRRILLQLARKIEPEAAGIPQYPDLAAGPGWMRDILLYIDDHLDEPLGLSELARRAAVSPAHFSRAFKQLVGMNLTDYTRAKRIVQAKELLLQSDRTVAEIAECCGFGSVPHFHRMFRRVLGMTPAAFRRSSAGLAGAYRAAFDEPSSSAAKQSGAHAR